MATVFNTVTQPDGTPQVGARVLIELSWNGKLGRNPKHDVLEVFVTRVYGAITDSNGYYEVDLFSGADLSPAGIVYKVTQRWNNDAGERFFIDVPDSIGSFWVGDIIVPKPSWEN